MKGDFVLFTHQPEKSEAVAWEVWRVDGKNDRKTASGVAASMAAALEQAHGSMTK